LAQTTEHWTYSNITCNMTLARAIAQLLVSFLASLMMEGCQGAELTSSGTKPTICPMVPPELPRPNPTMSTIIPFGAPRPSDHFKLGPDRHPLAASVGFEFGTEVFGVPLFAAAGVPKEALTHAASVMAEYLDNNRDGKPDDPLVVERMREVNASIIMNVNAEDENAWQRKMMESKGAHVGEFFNTYKTQQCYADETGYGACPLGDHCRGKEWDFSLEEVLHLITQYGHAVAYPEAFGMQWDSKLGHAIAAIIGDCQNAYTCDTGARNHPDRRLGRFHKEIILKSGRLLTETNCFDTCHQAFEGGTPCEPCENYAKGSFTKGSCSGLWHYYDWTCDASCLLNEGIYFGLTSLLGAQADRCEGIKHEWELGCTGEMKNTAISRPLYDLLTDETYRIPTQIPTGTYRPLESTISR